MYIIKESHFLSEFPWYSTCNGSLSDLNFITVSVLSVEVSSQFSGISLDTLQLWFSWELVVMVVTSYISFTVNNTAKSLHLQKNRMWRAPSHCEVCLQLHDVKNYSPMKMP